MSAVVSSIVLKKSTLLVLGHLKAHREAWTARIQSICAAAEARTNALLERLGIPRPIPSRSPEPPARCRRLNPFRRCRVAPLSVDPPADAGALKERTPRSPQPVFDFFQDLLHLRCSVSSVSSSDSFSSVDTQAPQELRDLPSITTPDEVSPPQTAFVQTPSPLPIASQPRRRRSLIPVLVQRFPTAPQPKRRKSLIPVLIQRVHQKPGQLFYFLTLKHHLSLKQQLCCDL